MWDISETKKPKVAWNTTIKRILPQSIFNQWRDLFLSGNRQLVFELSRVLKPQYENAANSNPAIAEGVKNRYNGRVVVDLAALAEPGCTSIPKGRFRVLTVHPTNNNSSFTTNQPGNQSANSTADGNSSSGNTTQDGSGSNHSTTTRKSRIAKPRTASRTHREENSQPTTPQTTNNAEEGPPKTAEDGKKRHKR